MEEMDSESEILNKACELFNLNYEEFYLIGYTDY